MSEYQYVVFQAVDGPLNDKQLEFAQRQSTRAEVSRWSLSVEYQYSSFRGDVDGLLRRGYDVYLEYTNYGSREIKLRLPRGMPFAKSVWSKYVDGEQFNWKSDAKGSGGILTLHPFHEAGDLDEIWETQTYLDAAIYVRERLMSGDLRALYLLWLCAADDDYNDPEEMIEPPVPHGIGGIATHGSELLSFFGLDPLLLVAAGSGVAPAPNAESANRRIGLLSSGWNRLMTNERKKCSIECWLATRQARKPACSPKFAIRRFQTVGRRATSSEASTNCCRKRQLCEQRKTRSKLAKPRQRPNGRQQRLSANVPTECRKC